MIFFSTLVAIFIWIASPSVKSAPIESTVFPLSPYSAQYEISWHGIPAGKSVHRLHQRKDGQYHFSVTTAPNVKILPFHHQESSDFTWAENKIAPQNYYYNAKEGKRHKKGNVVFDYEQQKIRNSALKEPWEETLPEGVQNKITQTLSIRHALKSGARHFHYMVAEEDKMKEYDFKIIGEENLKTKLGHLQTVKVEHISLKGARTTMWLAKKWDYLPVKMTQYRQGKLVAGGDILSYSPVSRSAT